MDINCIKSLIDKLFNFILQKIKKSVVLAQAVEFQMKFLPRSFRGLCQNIHVLIVRSRNQETRRILTRGCDLVARIAILNVNIPPSERDSTPGIEVCAFATRSRRQLRRSSSHNNFSNA
jgi:hypothetical protein